MARSAGVFNASKLAIILGVLCSLYLFRGIWLPAISTTPVYHTKTTYGETTAALSHDTAACLNAPGADRVMVILKTGASEIYEKLPTQLVTLFQCTPHSLIFSDLSQTLSDYTIHDALDTINPRYKEGHEDFDVYRKLQQYQSEGLDVAKLKGGKGWNLDKWKFLPMMHESYRMAPPEIDWFVYIEADTSLSWTNLLQFLGRLNPKKPLYMGAQNVIGPTTFAHGGSGFIISRGAIEKVEVGRAKRGIKEYDEAWEQSTANSCCGDEILARALNEVDVELTPSWPRIQGETVSTLDWTKKHWCAPALTWHHVSSAQVDTMWQFQSEWVEKHGWSKPYLFRDVFDTFVTRHMSVNRTSWNNLSQDRSFFKPTPESGEETKDEWEKLSKVEQASTESFENCAQACQDWKECVQWMFEEGICKLGKDVRLGDHDDRKGETWRSGWSQQRIQGMKDSLRDCRINWDSD